MKSLKSASMATSHDEKYHHKAHLEQCVGILMQKI